MTVRMGFPTFVADNGCVSYPPNMMIHMALDGAGTFRHQPFGRQKFLPISATIMSPKCPIKNVHKPLVP